jgi:hypothetical protein
MQSPVLYAAPASSAVDKEDFDAEGVKALLARACRKDGNSSECAYSMRVRTATGRMGGASHPELSLLARPKLMRSRTRCSLPCGYSSQGPAAAWKASLAISRTPASPSSAVRGGISSIPSNPQADASAPKKRRFPHIASTSAVFRGSFTASLSILNCSQVRIPP